MDAKAFARLVNRCGEKLEKQVCDTLISESLHLRSRALVQAAARRAQEMCEPLTSLSRNEVEQIIAEKYKLTDKRLITCLVPYQLAANILLSRLPVKIRGEAVTELKAEEAARAKGQRATSNKWIQWHDADVYVSTGVNYLKRINPRPQRRIPVFAILGHVNHGKTALLDALQGSHLGSEEPHHITQSIRAFTVAAPTNPQDLFTFIDSPGHRLFVETRFHIQLAADYIVLVVSVVGGIESQTHETIKVALNVDKPVIVVLNKLDLLSDAFSAEKAVQRIVAELHAVGLDVQLLQRDSDAEAVAAEICAEQRGGGTDALVRATEGQAEFFAPMKTVDPTYQGSKRHPKVHLRRKCYGVCVSAATKVRIPLLWRLLQLCRDSAPPTCHSNSASFKEHNGTVQAVVLESSKHLFDEEGFRLNRSRQRIQREMDVKRRRRTTAFEKQSPRVRLNALSNSAKKQSTRQNRTSSNCLVITAIVRDGIVSEGMHFIADQAEGQVHRLVDYWGNRIRHAYPGMAVTLIDTDSMSGCPGAGISVLSMTDLATRVRVQAYRQMLQWYVECFTSKLHYLRPRGMDVSFAHLGDYGQLEITDSLEYQLLYGVPPKSVEERKSPETLPPGSSATDESIGAYLTEKNRFSDASTLQTCSGAVSVAFPDGEAKRLAQDIVDKSTESVLVATWESVQRKEPIVSQEEYENFVAQCVQVGVLIKVDSWHTARMLHREIARLGTRKVFFQVVGARFGPLQVDDILFFGQAVKVIVCYRTPMAASSDLDTYIEANDMWVLQTDHFSDIVLFMKWCAVAAHKAEIAAAAGDEESAADGEPSGTRPHLVINAKKEASAETETPKQPVRKHKLLIYNVGSNDVA